MLLDAKIAVVIPCFLVADHIGQVVATIPEFVDHIVAVNDCCPEGTADALKDIDDSRLLVVFHDRNKGVGGAMITGYREALNLDADVIIKMDGDGQMDPKYLESLVEPVARGMCGYTKGNRFLHGKELQKMPATRMFGNIALTFLTKIASGYWNIFDPQNGYTAISRDALEAIDLNELDQRYFFENQMLILLNTRLIPVMDVPIPARYGNESSSLSIGHTLRHFPPLLVRGFLLRLWRRHVVLDFSPLVPLLVAGLFFVLFGIIFGAYHWISSIHTGIPATSGTVMLAVLPLILGAQAILQALLIDMASAPRAIEHSGLMGPKKRT